MSLEVSLATFSRVRRHNGDFLLRVGGVIP
jgi:hypothetical protein